MTPRQSFNDRLEAFFKANEGRWIEAVSLEDIAGRQAWRTRVSDVRKRLEAAGEGTIKNQVRRQTDGQGRTWVLSEYMFLAAKPKTLIDLAERLAS